MTSAYDKPVPIPANEDITRPFWEAAKRRELIIPYCNSCSNLFFYPREVCPNCFSKDLAWKTMSGKGSVYTYTHVRQSVHPSFQSENGLIYALIELGEGQEAEIREIAYKSGMRIKGFRADIAGILRVAILCHL